MFRSALLPIPLALLSCLAAACGDDGSLAQEQVDAAPENIPASEYCESISDFFCDFYLRCGRMNVNTKEECLSTFSESCNGRFEPSYIDLESAGLLALDPQGISECRSHLQQVDCADQVFELSGPCGGIWQGLQEPGEACSLDTEFFVCEAGSECVLNLSFCGNCRSISAIGEACVPGESTCGSLGHCVDGVCQARKQNGESCGEDDRCVNPASCVDEVCTSPIYVGLGDSCDRSRRCPYLSACLGGTCQTAYRLGEACDSSRPCATGYCASGLCTAPQPDGASCNSAGECATGLCDEGICQARPSACFN